ncbi:O-acetyltransferase OatA [Aquicella siphonis]|uniref:O-acetyltransferase OatA n=2 Tax=Aquicella siphonis TaxID=254247 RepID=A0A5E4PKK1_9COXI|nr:O-acetyltransferase OatA [Aquicella siphonis]
MRNLEIDRLRAIAVTLIIYAHYARIYFPWIISPDIRFLSSMADIFFVISGYVISAILIDQVDSLKPKASELAVFVKGFFLRRIYRIYPSAWVVIAAVILLSMFYNQNGLFSTPWKNMEAAVYIFTYTFNYFLVSQYHDLVLAPYWTLMIEEQFYLFFPFFILLTKNNRQRLAILAVLLLAITLVIRPLTMHYYPVSGLFFTQTRCDGFIYGFFIYYIMKQPWIGAIKPAATGAKLFRMLMVAIFLFVMAAVTIFDISVSVMIPVGAFMAFLLVFAASFNSQIIVFPYPLQWLLDIIGSRSYSLYLIHVPMILAAKELSDRIFRHDPQWQISGNIMAVIFIVVAGEVLYRLVERPTLLKGKALSLKMNEAFKTARHNPDLPDLEYVKESR